MQFMQQRGKRQREGTEERDGWGEGTEGRHEVGGGGGEGGKKGGGGGGEESGATKEGNMGRREESELPGR